MRKKQCVGGENFCTIKKQDNKEAIQSPIITQYIAQHYGSLVHLIIGIIWG